MAVWTKEWENLEPAGQRPGPGTKGAKLLESLDEAPTPYKQLWQRAGFDSDPFLRTCLRKCAKAGWVGRTIDEGDETELWSLPSTGTGGVENGTFKISEAE
jgi:hypothetical protein